MQYSSCFSFFCNLVCCFAFSVGWFKINLSFWLGLQNINDGRMAYNLSFVIMLHWGTFWAMYYYVIKKILNVWWLPLNAAMCRGVSPSLFLVENAKISPHFSINFSKQSTFPEWAAQCNGVFPAWSFALTGMLFSKHSSSESMFPLLQASWSGLASLESLSR